MKAIRINKTSGVITKNSINGSRRPIGRVDLKTKDVTYHVPLSNFNEKQRNQIEIRVSALLANLEA